MTKKQLHNLVVQSYTNESLDVKKVNSAALILTRSQLKQYIKELKRYESKKTVNIKVAQLPTKTYQQIFLKLFPNQQIVYTVDPTLLVGIQIINNDQIFDLNLKDTLDNLLTYVSSDL